MRLYQHPDFGPIIVATTEWLQHTGLTRINEQIVEKDYYVTEALRIVARNFGDSVLLKGGTSLSKGWNLIRRFSEDIDLFLNPKSYDPPLGESRIRRTLEQIKDLVNEHPGLEWTENDSGAENKVRADRFAYSATYKINPGIPTSVLVEAGVRSGDYPTAQVELASYVAQFLHSEGKGDIAQDLSPFPMTLLHFKRTFIEKLFTIHSKVEIMLAGGESKLGVHARHYYDLAQLIREPEVLTLLQSPDELSGIINDYYAITRKFFKHSPLPDDKSLMNSRALFPDADLRQALESAYRDQCGYLCFTDDYPPFDDVLLEFERIRKWI
jgi:hypothetical protein